MNDTAMVAMINAALEKFVDPGKNITGVPPVMGQKIFKHLVVNNKVKVYDYLLVGIAHPVDVAKANKAGMMFPYFNHNSEI